MKDHLMNLANIHAINFCKENNIFCAGSHITKHPLKQVYILVRSSTKEPIMTVTFHKSGVPTYQIY